MVFQNYALYPNMTVYGNMAYALKIRKMPKDEIDKKVRNAARILDLEKFNTGQSPVRDTPDPAFFEIGIVVDCGAIHHFHLISNFSLRIPNPPTPQLFAHFSLIFFTFFVTFSFIWCILIARIQQKKQILRFCTHQCYGPKQTEVSIHVL